MGRTGTTSSKLLTTTITRQLGRLAQQQPLALLALEAVGQPQATK